MMVFVIGGSASGKSAYAEEMAVALAAKEMRKKYYLAAMQTKDAESRKKADNHRNLRKGKGFVTIEQPTDIDRVLEKIAPGETALLECITNLVANEMFSGETQKTAKQAAEKVLSGIFMLEKHLADFVVVSGNVFEDGIEYPQATREYRKAMAIVNQRAAAMADKVIEVVVGIPIKVKPQAEEKQGGK